MKKSEKIKPLLAAIAKQVKNARSRVKISQENLAFAANVDRTYVSQLERAIANPSVEVLLRIADALNAELIISFEVARPPDTDTTAQVTRE